MVQRANERYMRGHYLRALRIINAAEAISQKSAYFPKKVLTISSLLIDLHKLTGWLFYPTILYKGICSFGGSRIEVGTPSLTILLPSDLALLRGATQYHMNLKEISTKRGTAQIVYWIISEIIGAYTHALFTTSVRPPSERLIGPERVLEMEKVLAEMNRRFPNNACPRMKSGYGPQLQKLLNYQLVSFRGDMERQIRASTAVYETQPTSTFSSRF